MTLEEFSLEFDIIYNNITSNQAPGLSELEKSIFLTQAQEAIVKQYYKGDLEQSFENTEEVTEYLNTLVSQKKYNEKDKVDNDSSILLSSKHYSSTFELPDDVMFITYESASVYTKTEPLVPSATKAVLVVPTTQDEFFNIHKNPFRGPSRNRAVRLIVDKKVEVISANPIKEYLVRYLRLPKPIVLPGAEEIEPYSEYSDGLNTELPESVHRNILMQAVALAKASWAS
jgi:hypothetical protein